jgi:hypothetical protein
MRLAESNKLKCGPERRAHGSWGPCVSGLKKRGMDKIGDLFDDSSTTSNGMGKWIVPLDPGHRIYPNTLWKGVLIEREGVRGRGFLNIKMGHVFACGERTRGDMAKQMVQLDSEHQVCLITVWKNVLTVEEGVRGWGNLKQQNWRRF